MDHDRPAMITCRPDCGACCIAPSITSPLPGMPDGKPAGVRCAHLMTDLRCGIYALPGRPAVCASFPAMAEHCGADRGEALVRLGDLERLTSCVREGADLP